MSDNKNKTIKESINHIEPTQGTKERMLANIKQKATEQMEKSENKPKKPMITTREKLIKWALPIAACFLIAMIGIQWIPNILKNTSNDYQGVEGNSPYVQVEGARVFSEQLNVNIEAPNGAENIEYYIIDKEIAAIYFEYNGILYIFNASRQTGDFSGLYGVTISTENIDAKNDAILSTMLNDDVTYRKITWTDGTINYILVNTGGANADSMLEIYNLIK